MNNDYFKKGSALAVSRLESAGIRLPLEPEYDMTKENPNLNEHQKVLWYPSCGNLAGNADNVA